MKRYIATIVVGSGLFRAWRGVSEMVRHPAPRNAPAVGDGCRRRRRPPSHRFDSTANRCGRTVSRRRRKLETRRSRRSLPREICGQTRIRPSRRARGALPAAVRPTRSSTCATARTSSTGFRGITREMPEIIVRGPAALHDDQTRLRIVPPAERQRPPGERASGGPPGLLLHPPDPGFSQRSPAQRRSAKAQHEHDDRSREGDDRRRSRGCRPSTSRRSNGLRGSASSRPTRCRRRASSAICFCRPRRSGPSRSPDESSRCRRMSNRRRRCEIRGRVSWRMSRPAASKRAGTS